MKNAFFWYVTSCASCKTDVPREYIVFIIRIKRISDVGTMLTVTSNRNELLVTVNFVSSSLIIFTLMMEVKFPPKRRLLQETHNITSKQMESDKKTFLYMDGTSQFSF
jgi:hypothetical protein